MSPHICLGADSVHCKFGCRTCIAIALAFFSVLQIAWHWLAGRPSRCTDRYSLWSSITMISSFARKACAGIQDLQAGRQAERASVLTCHVWCGLQLCLVAPAACSPGSPHDRGQKLSLAHGRNCRGQQTRRKIPSLS